MGLLHSRFIYNGVWDIVWNGYDTIFTFLNVFFIYLLCLNYKKDCKLIKDISINSLGIYFVHGLLIMLTIDMVKNEYLRNLPCNLLYSLILLLVCLLICEIIRKIPFINKLIGY